MPPIAILAGFDVVAASRSADDRVLRFVSTADHGPFRPVVSGVARATDVLAPLVATAAWLWTGGPARRSTVRRGVGAMAIAAAADSFLLKPFVDRRRPDPKRFPLPQRRAASPSTSAFPSGHLAATAAFSVVAGREVATVRLWLTAALLATGYARVYTGRHYFSDAVVGTLLGAAVGAARSRAASG